MSVELDRPGRVQKTSIGTGILPPVADAVTPHPLLQQVFEALQRAEMRWLVLRGERELATPGGDVDLLVEKDHLPVAEAILRRAGFVHVPTAGRGSHRLHVGLDERDGAWIKVDLVTELAFGAHFEYLAPFAGDCLMRRRFVGGVPVLDPNDGFWTLLLHCALDSRAFPDRHANRLRTLAAEAAADSQWTTTLPPNAADRSGAASSIASARVGDWPGLLQNSPSIERAWLRRQPVSARRRRVVAQVRRQLEPIKAFVVRPGLTVALLGPDGAGKSALAKEIARTFPFPARAVYMGLFRRPQRVDPVAMPGLDLIGRLMIAWRAYAIGRYHRALGRLVLFDRYTYDARVDSRAGHPLRDRLYFGLIARACPAPDLSIILDLPGQVAYARKGEHDAVSLESRRLAYLALSEVIRGSEVVDASRPLSEVRDDIVARIWRRYRIGSRR